MIYKFFLAHVKKLDWILVSAVVAVLALSLIALYGISKDSGLIYFKKQLLFAAAGFFFMVGLSFFDYRIFRNYSSVLIIIYLFCLLALVAVLLVGHETHGAANWINFGGFAIDPVEFAKLALILLLAKYFSLRHVELFQKRHLVVSFAYLALPVSFVLLQPDLGSASILIFIWLGMVIVSGIKFRHLIGIVLIGIILFSVMWAGFLKDYQKNRIMTFLNPQKDPLGYSYNLRQSVIAIGSGGAFGTGFGKGTQAQLKFLPESHTDFIFSIIAEEGGFAGVLILFTAFGLIIYRILKIGLSANDNFSMLFSMGFSIMLFVQILINAGMCLGVMPVVGIPLPFASYGGSSLMMNFLGLGVLQSIRVRS